MKVTETISMVITATTNMILEYLKNISSPIPLGKYNKLFSLA